jgi:uncharacterized protein (TIGR00251 family)
MTDTNTIIRVRVLPRTSKNQIVGMDGGVFKVKLTAPPVEGKANKALVQFLAKKLGLPKRDIEIVSGEHSREKTIRINGLPVDEVLGILTG